MIYKDQYKRQKTGGGLFCRESVGEKDIPDRHRCKQREVTVEISGDYYGYNQIWGTVEAQVLNYVIESQKRSGEVLDRWGGTATVSISSTTTKKIDYVENNRML